MRPRASHPGMLLQLGGRAAASPGLHGAGERAVLHAEVLLHDLKLHRTERRHAQL